jgi:hypothetical protein
MIGPTSFAKPSWPPRAICTRRRSVGWSAESGTSASPPSCAWLVGSRRPRASCSTASAEGAAIAPCRAAWPQERATSRRVVIVCCARRGKYPADDEGRFMRRKSLPAAYSESPAARASRPQFAIADTGALLRRRAFFRALRLGATGAVVSGLLASAKTSFGLPRPPATEDCVSSPLPASFLRV